MLTRSWNFAGAVMQWPFVPLLFVMRVSSWLSLAAVLRSAYRSAPFDRPRHEPSAPSSLGVAQGGRSERILVALSAPTCSIVSAASSCGVASFPDTQPQGFCGESQSLQPWTLL